jgi:hypothetical protein
VTEQQTVEPTEEDVARTIAEYETIAIGTGARAEFDAPEFTADGTTWSQVWLSQDPPVAARATARRDGAASTVVVLWADALPAEDSWRDLWLRRPMPLFGAYVRRDAIRHAFRDAIGDRREPGDHAPAPRPAAPARDWETELRAARTAEQLRAVWKDCKGQRTAALEVIFDARLADLNDNPWGTPGTPQPVFEVGRVMSDGSIDQAREVRTSTGALRVEASDARPGAPRDFLKPSSPKKRNRKKRGRR